MKTVNELCYEYKDKTKYFHILINYDSGKQISLLERGVRINSFFEKDFEMSSYVIGRAENRILVSGYMKGIWDEL